VNLQETPMSARTTHLENMIPELDGMRDTVAVAAREEADNHSHRAYLMQAKSLRTMYGQITSTWFNTAQEVKAETVEADEDVIELRYAERLGRWLRTHASNTGDMMEGGETDALNQHSFGESELAITRLYAHRHHEMVSDYCERHAAALDDRAATLRGDVLPRP
jgi:hypothetical protein